MIPSMLSPPRLASTSAASKFPSEICFNAAGTVAAGPTTPNSGLGEQRVDLEPDQELVFDHEDPFITHNSAASDAVLFLPAELGGSLMVQLTPNGSK